MKDYNALINDVRQQLDNIAKTFVDDAWAHATANPARRNSVKHLDRSMKEAQKHLGLLAGAHEFDVKDDAGDLVESSFWDDDVPDP